MKCFLLMGRLLIKVSENERQFEKKNQKQTLINQGGHAVQQLLLF